MLGKIELLSLLAGCNRGLATTPNDRAAILSAIARLESHTPNPRPLETPHLLGGDWRLLYTTSDELLGLDRFPFVNLGQIYQCLRLEESAVVNLGEINPSVPVWGDLPLLSGFVGVVARFTPLSAVRVQVKFERALVGSRGLARYAQPSLGEFVDRLVAAAPVPALQFPLNGDRQQGWLDVTYLDEDLRINRGNNDSVFVLARV